MTWAQDQRIAWIKERLEAGEKVNRADIAEKFYVTLQTATATLHKFRERHPGASVYCGTTKAFWAPDKAPAVIDWKARALAAEAALGGSGAQYSSGGEQLHAIDSPTTGTLGDVQRGLSASETPPAAFKGNAEPAHPRTVQLGGEVGLSHVADEALPVHGDSLPDRERVVSAPLEAERERGGRIVREAWVLWAKAQPDPKPSWLAPYDALSEPDKEADRQIFEACRAAQAPPAIAPAGVVEALTKTRRLVAEAAQTGFNCHDGDWAERLFRNQHALTKALASISPRGEGDEDAFRLFHAAFAMSCPPYGYEFIARRPPGQQWRLYDEHDNAIGDAASEIAARRVVASLSAPTAQPRPAGDEQEGE